MHATIRRCQPLSGTAEVLVQPIREAVARLSRVHGFVSCIVLESKPETLILVAVFEDELALEEARSIMDLTLTDQCGSRAFHDHLDTSGEIVFQRGL